MTAAAPLALLKRVVEVLCWPWWTVTTARHRHDPLVADRPDWTEAELAQLPHVRHPEQRLNDQATADLAEEGRRG